MIQVIIAFIIIFSVVATSLHWIIVTNETSRIRNYQQVIVLLLSLLIIVFLILISLSIFRYMEMFLYTPIELPPECKPMVTSKEVYVKNISTWLPASDCEIYNSRIIPYSPLGDESSFRYLVPYEESIYYGKDSPLNPQYFSKCESLQKIQTKFGVITWRGCPLYMEYGDKETIYVKLPLQEARHIESQQRFQEYEELGYPSDNREDGAEQVGPRLIFFGLGTAVFLCIIILLL